VLLNANVAFLAIPSVDPGERNRSPTQLASYLSIVASIGSVVTGLLLLRQHRTKPQDAAEEVVSYPIRSLSPLSLRSLRRRLLHNRTGISEVAFTMPLGSKLLRSCTVYHTRCCSGRE